MSLSTKFVLLLTLTSLAALDGTSVPSHFHVLNTPRVMLWAWERPEDLRLVAPDHVGVAFLAGSIYRCGWCYDVGEAQAHRPEQSACWSEAGTGVPPAVTIGPYSRARLNLLHKTYPQSEWAKKTPY
jgi:hypothetical protein